MKLREKKVNVFGRSIPLIAVVAVMFMVTIASAAVIATLTTPDVTIREPTAAVMTGNNYTVQPDEGQWDPGDTGDVELVIDNIADRDYGLTVIPTGTYSLAGSVTISVGIPDGTNITDDTVANDTNYNIKEADDDTAETKAEGTLTYTVDLGHEAESGGILTVSFDVDRVAPFA